METCGVYGLGCDCQANAIAQQKFNQLNGLGITKAEIEAFFIGPKKYVRNTKETPLYKAPGEAPFTTIAPNANMGMVVGINTKGNWGKLDSGYWILLVDSMYTVTLSVPPPTSIVDAVGREVKKVAEFSLQKILVPVALTAGVVVAVLYFGKTVIEKKATKVALAGPARNLKSGYKVKVKNTGQVGKVGFKNAEGYYVKFTDGSDGYFQAKDLKKLKK